MSELLRQHPDVDAGFEGGFLLADTPADFANIDPFYRMILPGWGLAGADLDELTASPDWPSLYEVLFRRFVGSGPRRWIVDKTPKYMEFLDAVMNKVPGIPAVTIVRDPRALFWSWRKRAEKELPPDWIERYAARYRRYGEGHARAESMFGDRLLLLRHEDLSLRPTEAAGRLFEFLGLDLLEEYLEFSPRFRNVRGGEIVSSYVVEYRDELSTEEQEAILTATEDFADWVWEPPPGFEADKGRPVEVPAEPRAPLRSEKIRALGVEVAARGGGGPESFYGHLEGVVDPRAAVLELGWPIVTDLPALRATRSTGYVRQFDWEGAFVFRGDESTLMDELRSRFDVVAAHSAIPMLNKAALRRFFDDVRSVLVDGGVCHCTAFVGRRPVGAGSFTTGRKAAPYHRSKRELGRISAGAGLVLEDIQDVGHPAGQVVVSFRVR